jgi:hypothetical protein
MLTRALDDESFQAAFVGRMRDVTDDAAPVTDIWPYVAAIPHEDLGGRRYQTEVVEVVYYLAVVVDRGAKAVFGHHILNLNEKYGLTPDS